MVIWSLGGKKEFSFELILVAMGKAMGFVTNSLQKMESGVMTGKAFLMKTMAVPDESFLFFSKAQEGDLNPLLQKEAKDS